MSRFGYFIFSLLLLIILGYGALVWFVNHEVEKGLDEAVAEVDGLSLTYDDLWVDLSDRTVTLTRPDAKLASGVEFLAEEVVVSAFDERHEIPHFIQVQAKGVVIPPQTAHRLGLPSDDGLRGDAVLDYRYDPANKSLKVTKFSFDDDSLGRLALSGTLTRLDLDAFRVEKLIGLRVKDGKLTFSDKGLMGLVYARAGALSGVSAAQARQQAVMEVQALMERGEREGQTDAVRSLQALKTFVENGGTVAISVAPKEPVPYLYLFLGRNLFENIDLLNLSVESQPDMLINK